jgi:hypothetical protein
LKKTKKRQREVDHLWWSLVKQQQQQQQQQLASMLGAALPVSEHCWPLQTHGGPPVRGKRRSSMMIIMMIMMMIGMMQKEVEEGETHTH